MIKKITALLGKPHIDRHLIWVRRWAQYLCAKLANLPSPQRSVFLPFMAYKTPVSAKHGVAKANKISQ